MGTAWSINLYWITYPTLSAYLVDGMNKEEEIYANNVFDECEIHTNCTVEIWRNSQTGEISIGWWENDG